MTCLRVFPSLGTDCQSTRMLSSACSSALVTLLCSMHGCMGNVYWRSLLWPLCCRYSGVWWKGVNKRFTTPAERRQHLADFHRFPWGLYYDSIHLGPKSNAGHPSRPQHAPESGAENTSALEARGREGERGAADDGKAASACAEVDSLIGGMSKLSSCDSEVPRVATFGRRNRHRAFS